MAAEIYNWKNKNVMITGASSGIGASFADELARKGANLILVARREDILQDTAKDLQKAHKIRVEVIRQDLAKAEAAEELMAEIERRELSIDVLINNAGIGSSGNFTATEVSETEGLINLNVVTLVKLTRLVLPQMLERDDGRILNIGSMVGYMPVPTFTSYAASKAFVVSFSNSLSYELRKTKVKVSVLSPGATQTEFFKSSGYKVKSLGDKVMMDSTEVARQGICAVEKGKRSTIAGCINKISIFLLHFVPPCIKLRLVYFISKLGRSKH